MSSFPLVGVEGGKIFTPAANVLEGITRRTVFDLAREIGIEVEAGDSPAVAPRSADEAFISSTAGGIMPVTKVDGETLGNGKPGPSVGGCVSCTGQNARQDG